MQIEFEDQPAIETYYEEASDMAIVGLACKGFLSTLCPTYADDWPLPGQDTLEARLARLQRTTIFSALRKGLRIEANFVNPYCDYANERAREESKFNPACREDLHRGLAALECLTHDLEQTGTKHEFQIGGEVEVWLMRCNPYVAYTHVSFRDDRPDLLRVGFLLFQRMGTAGPAIRLNQSAAGIWEAFHTHKGSLIGKRDFLFKWTGNRVQFRKDFPKPGGYNVFFSYNREDSAKVTHVGEQLYRRGLVHWQDTRSLAPGQEWEGAVQTAIVKCPAAVVFLGPHGLGYWQVREIHLLLAHAKEDQGARIIPVVLPGGAIPRDLAPEIAKFNMVNVRDMEDPSCMDEIAQAVREANGFG
jgi:hypothetical protein